MWVWTTNVGLTRLERLLHRASGRLPHLRASESAEASWATYRNVGREAEPAGGRQRARSGCQLRVATPPKLFRASRSKSSHTRLKEHHHCAFGARKGRWMPKRRQASRSHTCSCTRGRFTTRYDIMHSFAHDTTCLQARTLTCHSYHARTRSINAASHLKAGKAIEHERLSA